MSFSVTDWANLVALIILAIGFWVFLIWFLLHIGSEKSKGKGQPQLPKSVATDQLLEKDNLPRYFKHPLMTSHEEENYFRLKSVTDKLGLEIFTKVRLADLVEPNSNRKDQSALFNWVRSKHIDFVIWNPKSSSVVLLLEIWDSSHKSDDREKRDAFVRDLAKEVGYNFAMYPEVIPEKMEYKLKGLLRGNP